MPNPIENIEKNLSIEYAKWMTNKDTVSILKKESNKKEYFQSNVSYKNYIFSDHYFSNNTDSVTNIVEISTSSIKDSIGNFISHQYKIRFTLDLIHLLNI